MNVDLRTRYLGLELQHPIVASASPLTGSVESLARLQAGFRRDLVKEVIKDQQFEIEELRRYVSG